MNRNDLLRHLRNHRCELVREGGRHSVFQNTDRPERLAAVPRHSPIKWNTVVKICRELDIPKPTSR